MARMSRAPTLAAALAIAGCHTEPTPPIANDSAAAKPSAEPKAPASDARLVDDPGGQADIYGVPPPPPPSAKPKPKPTVPAPPYARRQLEFVIGDN